MRGFGVSLCGGEGPTGSRSSEASLRVCRDARLFTADYAKSSRSRSLLGDQIANTRVERRELDGIARFHKILDLLRW